MTLQRRLEWVWKTYGDRRPDVAFATAEVLRNAVYGRRGQTSAYFGAGAPSDITDDIRVLSNQPELTYAGAVGFYFREMIGREGHFYDSVEPTNVVTNYDKLVPWVAKTLLANMNSAHELLRHGVLGRIADWVAATRPDIMGLTLKQVRYREGRWHAALERKRRSEASRSRPGEVVLRFSDGWTVHKLSTAQQLAAEGETLGHCVGSGNYARQCAKGFIEIYSMRDETGVSRYTIEISVGHGPRIFTPPGPRMRVVKQVKGPKNARPKLAADCERLLAFLDQLPDITPFGAVHDLEHCLRKSGRWVSDIRDIRRNRRTSRRRTSRRAA